MIESNFDSMFIENKKCRMCDKNFSKDLTPSMIYRTYAKWDADWQYLCNDCAFQTVLFWDEDKK